VVETAVVVEPTPTAAPPTPQPTATAATPTEVNAMTFTVPATQARAVTNLWVEAGQTILIEYQSGSWRAGAPPTWPMVGPDGDAQVGSKLTFPVPDAPLASLVGGVGESRPFLVGPRAEFQSPATGVLWLGPNDDDVTDNEGSLVVRVALGPVATVSPPTATPLPAAGPTGVLAFSCGSGQQNQIFLSRLDGSLPYLLPNQPPNSVVPAFSPNGAQIAYRSNVDGAWQIYVSDLNGDNRRQITSGNANNYEAVWSPDGRRFAFVSDRFGSKQIFVMNVDGSNQQPLTPDNVVSDDPSWSSDDVIIYESNQDGRFNIYQISPQGGTPVVLISRGDSSSTPAWSPDGQRLAFEVLVRNVRHIWIANRDGSNLLPVTSQGNNNQRPAWSPDGRYIAFHSDYQQIATQYDIWVIELATQALTRITTRGDCYNPAWTVAPPVLSRTTWPVSPTGVEACHLADGLPVTAGDNARLWPVPDVTAGTALGDLAAGTALTVVGGPEWGPLRRDADFPGWWWEVTTRNGDLRGWLWEARLVECR
jgi:Tol biopolymer transport system component